MDPTKDNPLSVFLSKFILLYIKWPDSSSNGGEIVLEYVTTKKGVNMLDEQLMMSN